MLAEITGMEWPETIAFCVFCIALAVVLWAFIKHS